MKKGNDIACPHCGKKITSFKKPLSRQYLWNALWLVTAAAGLGLSFVFKRYFLQFLVVSLLAGFKWIVDQKAMKTQILIYKALKEESESPSRSRDLHQHSTRL